MTSRREFLTLAAATAAASGLSPAVLAQGGGVQRLTQADLLRPPGVGTLTILHLTDVHGQLVPHHYREPSVNVGVGALRGLLPYAHLPVASLDGDERIYAYTHNEFERFAKAYGRTGGMDRMATLIKAIRAERGAANVLTLDGGDSLQGSFTSLQTKGGDMVAVLDQLGVEATTGHWEFTLGDKRIKELFGDKEGPGQAKMAFLAQNIRDVDFEEPVFNGTKFFEKAGTKIAVIGQAFPFTPIANPRWMIPQWSFGIREAALRKSVTDARANGAEVVILLSHSGYGMDMALSHRVPGIDIILSAHTHDALPVLTRPNVVGQKIVGVEYKRRIDGPGPAVVVASGSAGKFLSRIDVEVENKRVKAVHLTSIPVLSDVIAPDPDMTKTIAAIRAPHEAMLQTSVATAETTLYRRGTFNGPLDDVICRALMEERDAEIALSPGFRWGSTIPAGAAITWDEIYNGTASTYPASYRNQMSGEMLKTIFEDVADNAFNTDPYYQQGGDMVRVGGLGFTLHVDKTIGNRVEDLVLLKTGEKIDPAKVYTVAGWGSIAEGQTGAPIWEILGSYLRREKTVGQKPSPAQIKIVRS